VVLEAETARFLSDKAALIVGVVGADGRPFATRGWGMTVLDHATGETRVLIDADDDARLAHLAGGGRIAVTGADVPTLRSCQVKGTVDGFDAATAADQAHVERYCDGYFGDIEAADHFPRHLLERQRPDRFVACRFVVEEVFDQTPGPHAGAPMVRAAP
jgi:hypothetical protein